MSVIFLYLGGGPVAYLYVGVAALLLGLVFWSIRRYVKERFK
jgi:hypothetical protein